jgi:hypothetical protein
MFSKVFTYTLAAVIFTVPTAWLATHAACIVYETARLCYWPGLYPLVTTLAAMLVVAPVGLIYGERARRRAAKGMWQKVPGSGFGVQGGWLTTLERTAKVIWGSDPTGEPPELITGEMRFDRRGWYIEVKSGRRVWVDRWDLWQWLARVEALARKLPAGESPIGERRWQPVIGRDLWLAYMDILEQVGAVEYPTDDLRSRRYVPGQPWGRVEEFEKVRGSERR